MSKYEPLGQYLKTQTSDSITVSFEEVATILDANLPRSAHTHPAWWANNPNGHSHCRAWIEAGWKTQNVNLSAGKLDFVRVEASGSSPAPASPWGALSGTVTLLDPDAIVDPTGETWAVS